jgi:hypothetical protein
MRCADGDLAIIVRDFAGCEANLGRVLEVRGPVKYSRTTGHACWRIKPVGTQPLLVVSAPHWEPEAVVVDWDRGIWHPDHWLLPITPTDYGDIAEHAESLSRQFDMVERRSRSISRGMFKLTLNCEQCS